MASKTSSGLTLRQVPPSRLVLTKSGRHSFGGPATHDGATPNRSKTPLHLMLTLSLADSNCPVQSSQRITRLPLYYPLKYGIGGGAVQYEVLSDSQINILYIDPRRADSPDIEYIHVDSLPPSNAQLIPFTYEQERALLQLQFGFHPVNAQDLKALDALDYNDMIQIGPNPTIGNGNEGDIFCRNPRCGRYRKRIAFQPVATVPPIPVGGTSEFWYEYDARVAAPHVIDRPLEFLFGLCPHCGTIIATNRAT